MYFLQWQMAEVGNVKNYMEYYFELNVVVLVHYYDFLLITSILTNIMVGTQWMTVWARSVYLVFPQLSLSRHARATCLGSCAAN